MRATTSSPRRLDLEVEARHNNEGKLPGATSPSSAADWELFAAGFNFLGPWNTSHRYEVNDLVRPPRRDVAGEEHQPQQAAGEQHRQLGEVRRERRTGPRGPIGPRGPAGPTRSETATGPPAFSFTSSPPACLARQWQDRARGERQAFLHNIGADNLALGLNALSSNTGGKRNTAIGDAALVSNDTGLSNPAVGSLALNQNLSGSFNTAVGQRALFSNTAGGNTAVGSAALFSTRRPGATQPWEAARWATTTLVRPTRPWAGGRSSPTRRPGATQPWGSAALKNSIGEENTALGAAALLSNKEGFWNAAVGKDALLENISGFANTAVGNLALFDNVSGFPQRGHRPWRRLLPTGPSNSIFIGNQGLAGDTTTIKIGTEGTQTSAFIAGILGVTTGVNDARIVLIDSNGQLGTVSSSRRYKEDIRPMGAMSDMLAKLRPVTFRYKKPYDDGSKPIQYGLIAEEVAEAFPYLAVFNDEGQPETVKYHLLPTFLLEGFQEQQTVIAAQAEKLSSSDARRYGGAPVAACRDRGDAGTGQA